MTWAPVTEGVRVLRPEEVADAQRQAREQFAQLARDRQWEVPVELLDYWYPATAGA